MSASSVAEMLDVLPTVREIETYHAKNRSMVVTASGASWCPSSQQAHCVTSSSNCSSMQSHCSSMQSHCTSRTPTCTK